MEEHGSGRGQGDGQGLQHLDPLAGGGGRIRRLFPAAFGQAGLFAASVLGPVLAHAQQNLGLIATRGRGPTGLVGPSLALGRLLRRPGEVVESFVGLGQVAAGRV